ncbi:MAG: tail fiber protein [Bacteroidota bacterium]
MQPTIAEIRIFAGNFAPRGWAFCHGQLLPINQNQALFSLLGTTYGGDGRTTFALPDMRGRFAMCTGRGAGLTQRNLGQKTGTEDNILTVLNLAQHNHQVAVTGGTNFVIPVGIGAADENSPSETYLTTQTNEFYSSVATAGQHMEGTVDFQAAMLNQGGQQSVNNMSPFTTLNYIIAMQGVFPSRN